MKPLNDFFDGLTERLESVFEHVDKLGSVVTEGMRDARDDEQHRIELVAVLLYDATPKDVHRIIWLVQNYRRIRISGGTYAFEYKSQWYRPKTTVPLRNVLDTVIRKETRDGYTG